MEPNELVKLSMRDLDRLKVLNEVLEGRLSQVLASQQLDLTPRQVRRLCGRLQAKGAPGIVHGLRGQPSNRRIDPDLVSKAVRLVRANYSDFGPTLACEKLLERDGVQISVNTLRRAMIVKGLWHLKRRSRRHRSWRARRACLGELVQVDGSIHAWFERRAPRCWLIAFVDDATSKLLWAQFAKSEDTITLMRLAKVYLRRFGRPLAYYVDQDSIYKTTRSPDIDEQLRDEQPMTQFTRAMSELGIRVICARSPQAKGRVERGFKTHQDRLVKELRLENISSIEEGNRFLVETYIPRHNKKFSLPPASNVDAHRPILRDQLLDRILCMRTPRAVANDFTIRWGRGYLQLLDSQPTPIREGDRVQVEVRLDDTVHVQFEDEYLNYKTSAKRPYRSFYQARPSKERQYVDHRIKGVGPIPAPDHPWRRRFLPIRPTVTNSNGDLTLEP